MPRRRYYGNQQGPRVIVRVRYVDNTPLAECPVPEMQWLVNGIVRMGVAAQYPADRPYDLAVALTRDNASLGIPFDAALRWLHYAPADNSFAQSLKAQFGSNGRLSEGQINCCRDLEPGERPRRGASRAQAPAPMPTATLPEPPAYTPAPAPFHAPDATISAPQPAPAPRPARPHRELAPAPADAGWSEATIRALWGSQATAIIAELRGNGIEVGP